ncbi:Sugar carrier protein C [Platanthera guangdongensis]|uniref:Sugar carrier protein C n=1 Tax=Platanthera guangdongensis TaxID=2320717 RepID=A0ABR2LHG9_9ASPA
MFSDDIAFLTGAALNGVVKSLRMLISGCILLGIVVGFTNQSALLYLYEMAPARLRGMVDWGWWLSLVLTGVLDTISTVGSLVLPDTPSSLIEHKHEEAKVMLQMVRDTDEVNEEFQDLVIAKIDSKTVRRQWMNIVQPCYWPQLTMVVVISFSKQVTVINTIMFYAPELFKIFWLGKQAVLMLSVITDIVNMGANTVYIVSVDKVRRRALFLEGGLQMFINHIVVGFLIGIQFGMIDAETVLSRGYATVVVFSSASTCRRWPGLGPWDAAGMAGAVRDLPAGDPTVTVEHHHVRQHVLHFRHLSGLHEHALSHGIQHLRCMSIPNNDLHCALPPGDEECSDREDDVRLEEPLVLGGVHPRRGSACPEQDASQGLPYLSIHASP